MMAVFPYDNIQISAPAGPPRICRALKAIPVRANMMRSTWVIDASVACHHSREELR